MDKRICEFGKIWYARLSVVFFISTINGKTDEVAKVLFNLRQVIFVGKSIGQHAIGFRVQTIVKDRGQILDLMEKIKAIDGVRLAVRVKV